MKIESKFDLGDKVKDKVTGFFGIVMGITKYALAPKTTKDGQVRDWVFIDEIRLTIVKRKAVVFDSKVPPGGPAIRIQQRSNK